MKKFDYLLLSKSLVLSAGMAMCSVGQAKQYWQDDIKIHGFATQDLFHSSDNNLYGKSDDAISVGHTEIGLNISYQLFDRLNLSAQGLYRRSGKVDGGVVRLDYGVADLNLFSFTNGQIGLRGGRIKVPLGLYNETRDVAFANPSIVLPQGIYYDRSRSLMVSADGGSLYGDYSTEYGDFGFKINLGMTLGDNEEILSSLLGPNARGEIDSVPAYVTQLNYEVNGGQYVTAVSFMSIKLDYLPANNDYLSAGNTKVKLLIFSAQYNGEKLGLTAEYLSRWNEYEDYGFMPDTSFVSESWYVQGSYRFLPYLQGTVRYDVFSYDVDDRDGKRTELNGLPHHLAFTKDWMVSLRWDITQSLMLRAEYHRINGTAGLPQSDNIDISKTTQHWDLYALQFSFRF